jgi:hypothetical protein
MNESKPVFYGIGIAGTVAAAASFVFALPVAKFGIFNRLEIVVIALLLCGAFAALGVSRCTADPAILRRMTRSPVAAILLLLAVWSIVVAPLAEYPWRSLLGPPQTGQGALAILALACIAAIVAAFGRGQRFRLALAVASSVGAVLSAVTHLAPERFRPFEVPGYFVLLGLAAAAALVSLSYPRRIRYSLAAVVLGLTLLVSENRTAFVAILAIGVPVVWISEFAIARGAATRLRRMATVAVLALPFAVTALVWAAGHAGFGASIIARARIYDVLLAAFVDRPMAILSGFGWGGVIEAFFRNLPAGAELLYGESWDVPVRDFHSAHNLALEFFVSAGFPGLLAAIALPAVVVLTASRRNLAAAAGFATAFAALSVIWHQQSFNLAPTIIGCALLSSGGRFHQCRLAPSLAPVLRVTGAVASLGLLVAAAWLADYGWRAERSIADARDSACLEGFPDDPGRGDMGLRYVLYGLTERARAQDALPADLVHRLYAVNCAVDRRLAAAPSLHLAVAAVLFRSEIAFDHRFQLSGGNLPDVLREWPAALRVLLDGAPLRTDLAVPYYAWLAASGEFASLGTATAKILQKNPQDVVGLWFSGLSMIVSGDPAVKRLAARRMEAAIDGGFDRISPVAPETRAQIRSLR